MSADFWQQHYLDFRKNRDMLGFTRLLQMSLGAAGDKIMPGFGHKLQFYTTLVTMLGKTFFGDAHTTYLLSFALGHRKSTKIP